MSKKAKRENAAKLIAEKVTAAENLIKDAEKIANKYGLSFRHSVAYGMGGEYEGDKNLRTDRWGDADPAEDGWSPSSHSC